VTMNALIDSLNSFDGAVVVVTHNFDLITKIECELYLVDLGTVGLYEGDYDDYIREIVNVD
jgi:ATP-binding cassette subfamily F protein 3